MTAREISKFKEKLAKDPDNQKARRDLHENYEWIEAFWYGKYGKSFQVESFCNEFDTYYWKNKDLKGIAKDLVYLPPVVSSSYGNEVTPDILAATYFLRQETGLIEEGYQKYENHNAIVVKWKNGSLYALMSILKQIRDNLFHGRKMDLDHDVYEGNKKLVKLAVRITKIILDNLEEAEAST
jgi:hypothetical protein